MRAGAWGATALVAVLMVGCGPQNPDDKVVATVMGDKITVGQVDAELRTVRVNKADDPGLRGAMLEQIVARKLMARAARAEGLDREPQVLRAKALADEAFDAKLYQTATLERVTRPTAAETAAYMQAHPERFARRVVYILDELKTQAPADKPLIDALLPTKSIAQAEAVLKTRNVAYVRVPDAVDTFNANPKLTEAIAKLPHGEPFLFPGDGGLIIGSVRSIRAAPLGGSDAERVAGRMLLAERRLVAAAMNMAALRKDTVIYADGYGPQPAGK